MNKDKRAVAKSVQIKLCTLFYSYSSNQVRETFNEISSF